MYNMDTGNKCPCAYGANVNRLSRGKYGEAGRSACPDLYQTYQVLSLHIPQLSSNDAFLMVECLWPIPRAYYMIYRQKIGIGCLVYCQHGGVRFVSFLYQYRYDLSHLILNGPEVFV